MKSKHRQAARAKRLDLTHARIKELLSYDKETGVFTWTSPGRTKRASNIAGTVTTGGYLQIQIDNAIHKAHRLAWFYMTGVYPTLEIDHINGIPSDNRFSNLREVDRTTNSQNMRRARVDNASGLIGAHFHKKYGWRSSIRINGKYVHIGVFDSAQDAHEAYLTKKREFHNGCTV